MQVKKKHMWSLVINVNKQFFVRNSVETFQVGLTKHLSLRSWPGRNPGFQLPQKMQSFAVTEHYICLCWQLKRWLAVSWECISSWEVDNKDVSLIGQKEIIQSFTVQG